MAAAHMTATSAAGSTPAQGVAPWLLLSLGLHLLLALGWTTPEPTTPPRQPLMVVLVEPRGSGDSPPQSKSARQPRQAAMILLPAPRKMTPLHPGTEPAAARSASPVASLSHDTAPAAQPQHVATAPPTSDTDRGTEELGAKLQQALARYFHYPPLAQRRGWQGEVLLAFRLESDGRIRDAHVARSSGYTMLDRAALASLQQLGGIATPLPNTRHMELPVIYRLQEG